MACGPSVAVPLVPLPDDRRPRDFVRLQTALVALHLLGGQLWGLSHGVFVKIALGFVDIRTKRTAFVAVVCHAYPFPPHGTLPNLAGRRAVDDLVHQPLLPAGLRHHELIVLVLYLASIFKHGRHMCPNMAPTKTPNCLEWSKNGPRWSTIVENGPQ